MTLLDFLFPPFCVSCQRDRDWWCVICRSRVELCVKPVTPPDGVDALFVVGFYHDPILRSAIHALKFRGMTVVRAGLEAHFLNWRRVVFVFPWDGEKDVGVQHVPATPARVRDRGFDQSEIVRDLFLTTFPDMSCVNGLKRFAGSGIPQSTIDHSGLRTANVHRMFFCAKNVVFPRTMILVDDVVTTGATMCDAARVLRERGVERIYGFALAVGA